MASAARATTRAATAATNLQKEIFRARLTESRAAFFIDMHTIADIVDAVASPYAEWRTLRDVKPEMRDGRPVYVTGNAAVSFRVEHEGRLKMLKCYIREQAYPSLRQ